MFGPFGERLSCARSALGKGGAGAPYRAQNFFCYFFSPKSEEKSLRCARVALRRVRAWAKHREMLPFTVVWPMSLSRAWRFFFIVEGGFGSFFRVVPLSSYSNPKNAGCGDNKRPFNRT
jgi:hypothetical protein